MTTDPNNFDEVVEKLPDIKKELTALKEINKSTDNFNNNTVNRANIIKDVKNYEPLTPEQSQNKLKETARQDFFANLGITIDTLPKDEKEPLSPKELRKIVLKEISDSTWDLELKKPELVPSPFTPDISVRPEVAEQQQRMLDDELKKKKLAQWLEWKEQYDKKRLEQQKRLKQTDFVKKIVDETEKIEIIDSDPPRYMIYLNKKRIELPAEELLNSKSFIVKYLCLFSEKIIIKPDDWSFLLEFWAINAEHIDEETLTEESALAEEILQKLTMRPVILIEHKNDEEIGNSLILDNANKIMYVPNYVIAQIIRSISPALRLNKVRFQLNNYLKGSTKIMRIGKTQQLLRTWQFDTKHFKLEEIN